MVFAAFGLTGCINPLPSSVSAKVSEPAALELLAASAEAHGGDERFAEVTEINVSYDGEWLNNVWKLQPMLVDREYRKSSVEKIYYGPNKTHKTQSWPTVHQVHTGPDGEAKKRVIWLGWLEAYSFDPSLVEGARGALQQPRVERRARTGPR